MQPAADGLLVVQYLCYFVGIVVRPLSRLVGPNIVCRVYVVVEDNLCSQVVSLQVD